MTTVVESSVLVESAFVHQDLDALKTFLKVASEPMSDDRRAAIDTDFRSFVSKALVHADEIAEEQLKSYVRFAIEMVKQDLCLGTTAAVVLSDIFDSITIDRCEVLFEFMETLTEVWRSAEFFAQSRNIVLRMCNDLLRRLSRSVHIVFCGKILVFLARILPLTEKSGLNLASQFNLDNVTRFDQQSEVTGPSSDQDSESTSRRTTNSGDPDLRVTPGGSEMEEGEMKESDLVVCGPSPPPTIDPADSVRIAPPVDFNLYRKLWELQRFFVNPMILYTPSQWQAFRTNAECILAAFDSDKLDISSRDWNKNEPKPSSSSCTNDGNTSKEINSQTLGDNDRGWPDQTGRQRKLNPDWGADPDFKFSLHSSSSSDNNCDGKLSPGEQDNYFSKYLTNQKLLQLQLDDNNFRRYILIQFLIAFQFLGADCKVKEKVAKDLTDDQVLWVEEQEAVIHRLLRETPPHGAEFCDTVLHILKREEYWSDWKNANCEDFTALAGVKKIPVFRRRNRTRYSEKTVDMARPELTNLWKLPDNFSACRSKTRRFVPPVEEFFEEIMSADAETLEKKCQDDNWCWRALRALSSGSSHFFVPPNAAAQHLVVKDFMQYMLERLRKEAANRAAAAALFADQTAAAAAADLDAAVDVSGGATLSNQSGVRIVLTQDGVNSCFQHPAVAGLISATGGTQPAGSMSGTSSPGLEENVGPDAGSAVDDDEDFGAGSSSVSPGRFPVSEAQTKLLSGLIGSDYETMLKHLIAEEEIEDGPYRLFVVSEDDSPERTCQLLLNLWLKVENEEATVRCLTSLLQDCELFNEDVANILSLCSANGRGGGGSIANSPRYVGQSQDVMDEGVAGGSGDQSAE